jgi:hypothetical protein
MTTTKTVPQTNPIAPNAKTGQPTTTTTNAGYLWQQPPFDNRIHTIYNPLGFASGTSNPNFSTPLGFGNPSGATFPTAAVIQRGFMSWDPNNQWSPPYSKNNNWAGAPKVLFLYNPSTVEASYSIDNIGAQASLMYPVATSNTNLVLPLQQTVGFTIMFDRTYEMNTASSSPQMQALGCEVDVLAMKQFTGMFSSVGSANVQSGDPASGNPFLGTGTAAPNTIPTLNAALNTANPNSGAVLQGVMCYQPSYVFFGAPQASICYYGVVSSWDVQYTHFAQNMVPMRCVIDVSYTLLPPPTTSVAKDASATSAKQQGPTFNPNPSVKPGPNGLGPTNPAAPVRTPPSILGAR